MTNILVDFLKKVAEENNYQVFDSIYGDITLANIAKIEQSSGSVYGIWAQCDSSPDGKVESIKGHTDWFPIYWGKDVAPVSRMKAHVQDHKNTGNIALRKVKEIQGKRVIFGAIMVSNYEAFEKLLHKQYRPMKGSSRSGKKSTVIEIVN